jgi:hypothetical protein
MILTLDEVRSWKEIPSKSEKKGKGNAAEEEEENGRERKNISLFFHRLKQ